MGSRTYRVRRAFVRLAIPSLFAFAMAAILLLRESPQPLSALSLEDAGKVSHGPAGHGAGEPAHEHTPPAPEGDARPVTDLLADPALLDLGTTRGATYVPFTDGSGLWAIANPTRLLRTGPGAWSPGRGLQFLEDDGEIDKARPDGRSVNLSIHESLVRNRCVILDISSDEAFGMLMANMERVQRLDVPAGRGPVPVTCPGSDLARESLLVTLRLDPSTPDHVDPVVMGVWIVPAGMAPPASPPPAPRPCGTAGLELEPGRTLAARTLAVTGSTLEMDASGPSLEMLSLDVRSHPGGERALVEPPSGASASKRMAWPLELERQQPIEIVASLPQEAPGPLCLERLVVVHPPPVPSLFDEAFASAGGVVIIVLDTLRADEPRALNPRGQVLTPVLQELASRSLVFRDATAHANYTKPSVSAILTGLYPHTTGTLSHAGALSEEFETLAEVLERSGVETLGLFSNRFLSHEFGFMRGWQTEVHVDAFKAARRGDIVAEAAHEMLRSWRPGGPFFLYIHLMDPHAPYDPPLSHTVKYVGHRVLDGRFTPKSTAAFITNLRRGRVDPPDDRELKILRGLYRGDVAAMDAVLGRILDDLRATGVLDRALTVVTSDHGEEFMEHGWLGHGTNIHPEITHIPLVVRMPDGHPSGSVPGLVGHLDLAPTVLAALGLSAPPEMPGTSLQARVASPVDPSSPPAFLLEHWNGTCGMRLGQWMVLAHRKSTSIARLDGHRVWYQDPERNPVKWFYLRQRLALLLLASRGQLDRGVEAAIDDGTRTELEALGYILEGKDGATDG